MKTMSDITFKDQLPSLQKRYLCLTTKHARTDLLNCICRTYGMNRKYLIKLLRGLRVYKPYTGKCDTYSKDAKDLLYKLWGQVQEPCSLYFREMLAQTLKDYESIMKCEIESEIKVQILRMSASTIGRIVSAPHRRKSRKRNKCSGSNHLKERIPALPGSEIEDNAPGVMQVDTVALCGGSLSGSFFYIVSMTDADTQWTEIAPTWNKGAFTTCQAIQEMEDRLPFPLRKLHPDNGTEFINYHLEGYIRNHAPECELSRSRPYHKNDNCRIEQKNGSIVRVYFQDTRFDYQEHNEALRKVCKDISLYVNLFLPTKKLIEKTRTEQKGVHYTKRYDKPQTPFDRLLKAEHDQEKVQKYKKLKEKTNSIQLLRKIQRQLNALVNKMNKLTSESHNKEI